MHENAGEIELGVVQSIVENSARTIKRFTLILVWIAINIITNTISLFVFENKPLFMFTLVTHVVLLIVTLCFIVKEKVYVKPYKKFYKVTTKGDK